MEIEIVALKVKKYVGRKLWREIREKYDSARYIYNVSSERLHFLSAFKEGAYDTEDLSTGFSMPCGVYKKFREQICLMVHGVRPTEIWSNIENWEGKPFVEFISFADTGGSFDYLIAEKLYKDFSDFKEKVKQDIPNWYDSYCAYMDILKIASDNKGVVCYS